MYVARPAAGDLLFAIDVFMWHCWKRGSITLTVVEIRGGSS